MGIPEGYQIQTGSEKTEFAPLPDDTYEVAISKIELRTDQAVYNKPGEVEDRFSFEFTVTETGEFTGRKLWLDVRPVMSAGFDGGNASWLYKIFCAVNGAELTDEEAKGVGVSNINQMEGQVLRLVVKQKRNTKGVLRNKITDVLPIKGRGKAAVVEIEPENFPF